MRYLRQNTAVRVTVGPFFDKTDGVTPETGITVTSCKLTLMVDDANVPTLVLDTAPTASGGSNDMVHVSGDDAGFYDLELAAANVNYLGRAMLAITDAAVHCPVFHEFMILPAVVYDALVLGTDYLSVKTRGNVKKNEALTGFMFMMTDSTTHAPVTGKTVTVTRAIDGGSFASGTLGTVAEVGNGIYSVDFGSGDLNGNTIILRATASGSDDTFVRISTDV